MDVTMGRLNDISTIRQNSESSQMTEGDLDHLTGE
jgi:hypothetical protein